MLSAKAVDFLNIPTARVETTASLWQILATKNEDVGRNDLFFEQNTRS